MIYTTKRIAVYKVLLIERGMLNSTIITFISAVAQGVLSMLIYSRKKLNMKLKMVKLFAVIPGFYAFRWVHCDLLCNWIKHFAVFSNLH